MADLPPAAVSPDLYDERYYRQTCAGAEIWDGTDGAQIHPQYPAVLRMAGLAPGEVLLDVGCGRGELLVAAVQAGAVEAIGIEYSAAARALAARTLAAHGAEATCRVLDGDARRLPLGDASADLVTLLDVVEHLAPEELAAALAEARRALRPGGRIFIHTMPNRWVFTITYRLMRLLAPWRLRTWPQDPRTPEERTMHVNELTRRELAGSLRAAGFDHVEVRYGAWVREDIAPTRAGRLTLRVLAKLRPTRPLGAADLWASARR